MPDLTDEQVALLEAAYKAYDETGPDLMLSIVAVARVALGRAAEEARRLVSNMAPDRKADYVRDAILALIPTEKEKTL